MAHPFWNAHALRVDICNALINKAPMSHKDYVLWKRAGEEKLLRLHFKIAMGYGAKETTLFIIVEEREFA